MHCRHGYCALALVGMLASSAAAQTASAPTKQPTSQELDKAREHFKAAEAAKQRGEYQIAIQQYIAAYTLFQHPELLFDIGEVCRLAGDDARALRYFQKYLELDPNGRGASTARAAVDELQGAMAAKSVLGHPTSVDTQRKLDEGVKGRVDVAARPGGNTPVERKTGNDETEPGATRVQPSVSPLSRAGTDLPVAAPGDPHASAVTQINPTVSTTPTTWHWYDDKLGDGIAIGGVAVAASGLILYTRARSDIDSAQKASDYVEARRLVDSANSKATISVGLAIGGGALVAIGIVRCLLHANASGERTVSVAPAKRGGIITYRVTF